MNTDYSQSLYEDSSTVGYYANRNSLLFGEETLLKEVGQNLAGARILDLGVGAGRTTPFLMAYKPSVYVGVDYAENMVACCKDRFPALDFRVADARNMKEFPDESFDFILFSWNGIDSVTHEGRLQVLEEVFRLLADGGVFVFSSANGRNKPVKPWSIAAMRYRGLKLTPRNLVFGLKEYVSGIFNYMVRMRCQEFREEYSIQVDVGHNFKLLRYLVAPEMQFTQLTRIGFSNVRVVDKFGAFRDLADPNFKECPVGYVCGKPRA